VLGWRLGFRRNIRRENLRREQHHTQLQGTSADRNAVCSLPAVKPCYEVLLTPAPLRRPDAAVRKLLELAYAFEPVQDGRIYIEKINEPFLYKLTGTPAEYKAGLDYVNHQELADPA
jgi:hypothetical protein